MRTRLLLSAMPLLMLLGCDAGKNKRAAEQKIDDYFHALAAADYAAALSLYGPEFFQQTPADRWRQMLITLHGKLGSYQSHSVVGWNYHTKTGTTRLQTTVVKCQVKYANAEATETFTFHGDASSLKIVGHQINSAALLASPTTAP
jgi:hypothetical protein